MKTIAHGGFIRHMIGVLVYLSVIGPAAVAQDLSSQTISEVRVSGLERVSEQVVRAKLEVQPGQDFNPRAVARDIRRIYETGYFTHVKADVSSVAAGVVLTYLVEEKRFVEEVRIMGGKKIKERKIRGVVKLRAGDSFVPDMVEEDTQAILRLYEGRGYANTQVEAVTEEVGPSRIRVTYTVTEGKKARIRSITFTGNETLSKRRLRKIVKTRKAWWFFGGKYEEEKFEADLQRIIDAYGDVGHLEAVIANTDLFYTKNGKGMEITIDIAEGPQYKVDQVEIARNLVFDDDEIMNIVDIHDGDIHNRTQVRADAELVEKGYQDSGYINAIVTPQVTLNREDHTTHVIHHIEEGDLKYVRDVRITGNAVTKDEIIRREMMIEPGDRYDGSLLKFSQQRLNNTRYFEEIRIFPEEIAGDDLFTDLLVDVEEGKTGNFNFGAGFSTEEGLGGFAELKLDNFDITNWPSFSGGGQQFKLKLNIGDVRDEFSLSFTEPEFLGYPVAFGFDIFNESYRVTGGADYTEEEQGGQLRLGKTLSPYVSTRANLRYESTELSRLPWFVNEEIRRQRGSNTTISVGWEIERNTIDNHRNPGRGGRHRFALQLAGLGGDNEFYKVEHDSSWFYPLDVQEKWIISFRTREGYVTEYGGSDYVPLQDRYYAGGTSTVRGYENRDIGPKVKEFLWWGDDFAIGGNIRLVTNFELKYKINETLRVYSFLDSGGVWEDASDFDFGDIKHSIGLGFGVDVPRLGPIRVDYGYPLNPDEDQGSGRMHLTTGFSF